MGFAVCRVELIAWCMQCSIKCLGCFLLSCYVWYDEVCVLSRVRNVSACLLQPRASPGFLRGTVYARQG